MFQLSSYEKIVRAATEEDSARFFMSISNKQTKTYKVIKKAPYKFAVARQKSFVETIALSSVL